MADDEYEGQGESGASNTYPQQCSALRKNGYVVMKNRPCKIVEMSTSKTGKHGHAKVSSRVMGKKIPPPITVNEEYRTFRTKDFSHKSFSASFGPFAQFLEVVSHNNYK